MVLVFAKYPVPGQVKTRLARDLGAEAACAVYRWCAEKVWAECQGLSPVLCYDPSHPASDYQRWLGASCCWPQQGEDLGARMEHALRRALQHGSQALLIGTDCPQLTCAALQVAQQRLHQADVVLGPCPDGGYYLVGVRGHVPDMFGGIEWSTPRVLAQTLERLADSRVELLPVEADIDTIEDLRAWARAAAGMPST